MVFVLGVVMARIEWVKQRLENWARWVVQREAGGMGYPRRAVFTREMGVSASTEWMSLPIDDVDAERTHRAVESIRLMHSPLWLVVQCHYVGDPQARPAVRRPMATDEIAQRMCCTRRAVQLRMEQADCMLAPVLNRKDAA